MFDCGLRKKCGYEYGSWNLFVLINQLLGIHKLIPTPVVTRNTQGKVPRPSRLSSTRLAPPARLARSQ